MNQKFQRAPNQREIHGRYLKMQGPSWKWFHYIFLEPSNGQIGSSNILTRPFADFKIQNSHPVHVLSLHSPNSNGNPTHGAGNWQQRLVALPASPHPARPSPYQRCRAPPLPFKYRPHSCPHPTTVSAPRSPRFSFRLHRTRRIACSSALREKLIENWWWWTWARSSTPRSTSTTPTNTGTSSSRPRSPSSSPRTASSPRTSGVPSACSRAAGGCTTRSTGRSPTSCSSAARSTTSSSRRRRPRRQRRCCPSDCRCQGRRRLGL